MEHTLQWLLEESELSGLKLLTCKQYLKSRICGVNIMDNPDTFRWIKPGELVLTTGYVFLENPSLQESMIADLKKAGCCALCIKSKRFLDEIPQAMLAASEAEGLPLIELPAYYSLADISEEITKNLFQEQFQDVLKEQTLLNTLFNCYFQGNSMEEILKILSEHTGTSVFILDNNKAGSWYALSPEDQALVQEDNIRFELLSLQGQKSSVHFQDSIRRAALMPFSNSRYSLCILYEPEHEPNWDTMSHALMILDFTRNNVEIKHSHVMNYYDSFFHFLMSEESFSEAYQLQICGYYGLPQPSNCICLLISVYEKDSASLKHMVNEYEKQLHASSLSKSAYFIAWNNTTICICFFKDKGRQLYDKIRSFVAESAKNSKAVFGISRPDLLPLREAYQEASLMLSLSGIFPEQHAFFFQDHLLFWNISRMSSEERSAVYQMTVKPLVDYDREANASLTETLTAYFKCHLNASQAAARLYIHRNTFQNRMEKIHSLMEFHPDDYNNLYSVYFGLCVYLYDHRSPNS